LERGLPDRAILPVGASRIIIVGGVAAGMSAASQAKRHDPGAEVIALEQGEFASYASCGIPYYISEVVKDHRTLIAVTPGEFREKRKIDLRLHHKAREIRPAEGVISVSDLKKKKTFDIPYDKLVICAGARSTRLTIPGSESENVFYLRGLNDGIRLMGFLRDRNPARAVIIGAGYVGLELAEAFRARGMVVTIIARSAAVMRRLEPDISSIVEDELDSQGAVLKKETNIEEFETKNGMVRGIVTDKGEIETDIVLMAIGIRPNSELARAAGVKLGAMGAIAVNDRMETSAENIYSAGDCAETFHRVTGKPAWIPLGDTANKQGRVAGANAAGGSETFPGVVGSSVAKVFDLAVARTGLSIGEAKEAGFNPASHTTTDRSRAAYYPGSKPLTITLIFDKSSERLLGAQLVGPDGVAKRNDVLATAITAGMTLRDIENLDLCYAPPYSPVYDPLLVAARQARKS